MAKVLATRQGLEPQFFGPKPNVLPLDEQVIAYLYAPILYHTLLFFGSFHPCHLEHCKLERERRY